MRVILSPNTASFTWQTRYKLSHFCYCVKTRSPPSSISSKQTFGNTEKLQTQIFPRAKMSCFGLIKKDERNVLYVCKERKRLLKLAVERRKAFAAAQCKYNNAHFRVAKSLGLFVARQSSHSSSSPGPITEPSSSENPHNNDRSQTFPMQKLKEPTNEATSCQPTKEKQNTEPNTPVDKKQKCVILEEWEDEGEHEDDDDEVGSDCEYFFDEMPPILEQGEAGCSSNWDYFDSYNHMEGSLGMNSVDCVMRVRQLEGMPDLEEVEDILVNPTNFESVYRSVSSCLESGVSQVNVEVSSKAIHESAGESSRQVSKKNEAPINKSVAGEKIEENKDSKPKGKQTAKSDSSGGVSDEVKMEKDDDAANMSLGEPQDLTVTRKKTNKELMKALEEIEALFIKAYEAGLAVSKMMEATKVQLRNGLTENSNGIFWSIVRNQSRLSGCTSCRCVLPSISHTYSSSTAGTEPTNDNISESGGMMSGSHLMSMGKLYEWEKKLYEDVKMGENRRKLFEKECAILRKKEERDRGEVFHLADETRLKVKSLDASILVSVQCAASISNRIIRVRDEELGPQLFELLRGLMNMWKAVSTSYETQSRIMFEVTTFNSLNGKYCSHFHRHATHELEAQLKKWRTCFSEYVTAQKSYIKALDAWFSTCNIGPEPDQADEYPGGSSSSSVPPCRIDDNGPPVIAVCHEWMVAMEKLPDKAVMSAMKSFRKEIKALSVQQRKEQKLKKKVDGLIRELDRKVSALQKAENKILKLKESKMEIDGDFQDKMDKLEDKKTSLEELKQEVELEKAKHISGMEDTQRATLSGFQTGFSQVFESLVGFSKATVKMYEDLVTYFENVKATGENSASSSS